MSILKKTIFLAICYLVCLILSKKHVLTDPIGEKGLNNNNDWDRYIDESEDKNNLDQDLDEDSLFSSDTEINQPEFECSYPSNDYLESVLLEYFSYYRKYQESIYEKLLNNEEISNQNYETGRYSHFVENTECLHLNRNKTRINHQSLCPWQYVITHRLDRYPFYRKQVKCTCENCSNIKSKKDFKCMPIVKTQPVLLRTGCSQDGYYKWIPSVEEVNVACVCALIRKAYPF
jgi:hypothetical protein